TDKNGDARAHPHMKPEVVAPGERIISTGEDNLWYSSSGSSDATVFVTGALALILEDQPRLKPQPGGNASCLLEVKQALLESLGQGDGLHDLRSGYGLLSASAWLSEARDIPSC
ncbi:MAG: S8 family serine peptidase, partial [Poseidonia sp.]